MNKPQQQRLRCVARGLMVVAGLLVWTHPAWAEPPTELPPPRPMTELPKPNPNLVLSAAGAVGWALEHNPELATARKLVGIAEAGVQIARQYPFNPIVQDFVWGAGGPSSAGITNRVFNEHTARLDLELRRQGMHRRAMARSALTRVEWEVAAQELLMAVRVARAFNTLLYRREKAVLVEETIKLQEDALNQVNQLTQQGKLSNADVLLARADVMEARNLRGPAKSVLVTAGNDLRRVLGLVQDDFNVEGTLEVMPPHPDPAVLTQCALERRPDLHALEFGVQEAENRLRLEVANRWGNPSLGPAFEYNETSVYFVGMWLIWSPPVFNTRKGEIKQREAERARAIQAVQQSEIQIKQDIYAAVTRLTTAEEMVKQFQTQTLPELRKMREVFDKLLAQGDPGTNIAQALDIRRRLLRARDVYLDALWEMSQARVDLAAAVADLTLAACNPPLLSPATASATGHP
jgi:outer membrane protein TolC